MQLEKQVQQAIKRRLEKHGWFVAKMELSQSGFPDLMCLKNGEAVFIEVKQKGKKARPLQQYRLDQLTGFGFKAFCADSKDNQDINLMCN